jgi:membrane dipeptidase
LIRVAGLETFMSDALSIHSRNPVIDGHADTIGRFLSDPGGFFTGRPEGHLDGLKMQKAQQNVQIMAVCTPPEYSDLTALQYALDFIHAFHSVVESPFNLALQSPFRLILSAQDLDAACAPGNCGLLLFLEGASPLRGSMKNLDAFWRLGVRGITLTHNHDNEAARGCLAQGNDIGLTPFGRELVREMEARGMAIDLAHANERTFWDTIEMARRPLIDSHTGFRRFWDHPRNLSDTQLEAIAAKDGVVCVDFVPDHVMARKDPRERVRIEDVVHVITHGVERAGIDHVGIGADWDGFQETVEGLEDASTTPRLTEALLKEGFPEENLAKIIGGNLLRVLSEVLD